MECSYKQRRKSVPVATFLIRLLMLAGLIAGVGWFVESAKVSNLRPACQTCLPTPSHNALLCAYCRTIRHKLVIQNKATGFFRILKNRPIVAKLPSEVLGRPGTSRDVCRYPEAP